MKEKKTLLLSIITALVVAAIAINIYIGQLNNAVTESTQKNIEELALHDIKSVEGLTGRTWKELEHIAERLALYNYMSVREVQKQLILERSSSSFDAVYLLDEQGNAYTDTLIKMDRTEQKFEAYFTEYGNEPFVVRYQETDGYSELKKATLMYGVPVEPIRVGETTFVGILGRTKISDVQDQLRIQSFGGRGYSSIIDSNGNYIVGPDVNLGINEKDNFYQNIESGECLNDTGVETVKRRIDNGELFHLSFKDERGTKKHMVLQPVQQTHWYFITTVSDSVYVEQSQKFIAMSTVMMIVVAAIIFALTLLLFYSKRKVMQASAVADAKSEFLSNMSHEIRTPLNGLIGLNHLMMVNIDDKERLNDFLQKSSKTAQYLLALLNDILDASKLQAGKFELDSKPVCLDHIVEEVCAMQRETISSRGIVFQVEMEIRESWITGDEVRIKQVLMNLLSNAGKFTPSGGTIVLRVTQHQVQEDFIDTIFQVEDSGCGISRDFQEHIFESFSQERNKNLSSQKGTGLGLAISYLLMKQMGGDLTVKSELEKGSCFSALMPARIALQPQTFSGVYESETVESDQGSEEIKLHVLIAEDNELNAEILKEILEAERCSVACAGDGREAVKLFQDSAPGDFDAILMDVQMPNMDGYEAAETIRSMQRADAKTIPIIACTAGTFKEEQKKAFDSGMNDFLAKPVEIDVLVGKLDTLRRKKVQ